jgi:hypothetical protein
MPAAGLVKVPSMGYSSPPDLLVLHAVRVLGMADGPAVARRFGLDPAVTEELLLDFQASGWIQCVSFADILGWALTDAGRAEDMRRLSTELDQTGARPTVATAYAHFDKLNKRFLKVITNWQIRPSQVDAMARNDHGDQAWDDRVLGALGQLDHSLRPLCANLLDALDRFDGYADRFSAALDRAVQGDGSWVAGIGIDSCHTGWFQLHEDLLATLNIERGHG